MKLKSIFKKSKRKPVSRTQTLNRKQLEKVIGGAEVKTDQKGVAALDGNPSI